MIAERIYRGESAEEIGIKVIEYASRKAVVDRFLSEWRGTDFVADYLAWLPSQSEGGADDWSADKPSRGVGDTVAKMTTALGIKPCGGCKQRQKLLNRILPYKDKA